MHFACMRRDRAHMPGRSRSASVMRGKLTPTDALPPLQFYVLFDKMTKIFAEGRDRIMSIEIAKAWLTARGVAPERILEFPVSSATVELAAKALGCAPERIAKSLALRRNVSAS